MGIAWENASPFRPLDRHLLEAIASCRNCHFFLSIFTFKELLKQNHLINSPLCDLILKHRYIPSKWHMSIISKNHMRQKLKYTVFIRNIELPQGSSESQELLAWRDQAMPGSTGLWESYTYQSPSYLQAMCSMQIRSLFHHELTGIWREEMCEVWEAHNVWQYSPHLSSLAKVGRFFQKTTHTVVPSQLFQNRLLTIGNWSLWKK